MDWLKIIVGALAILSALTRYFNRRQLIDGAQAQVALQALQESQDVIAKANAARDAQLDADRRDPGRMRNDADPYRRD